jgi:hypothetical protein
MACLHRLPHAAGERDPYSQSASVRPEPAVVSRVKDPTKNLRTRRYSVIAAGHAPLVRARRFSVHALEGAEGLRGAAGSGQLFAKREVVMADRLQRGS